MPRPTNLFTDTKIARYLRLILDLGVVEQSEIRRMWFTEGGRKLDRADTLPSYLIDSVYITRMLPLRKRNGYWLRWSGGTKQQIVSALSPAAYDLAFRFWEERFLRDDEEAARWLPIFQKVGTR